MASEEESPPKDLKFSHVIQLGPFNCYLLAKFYTA